MSVDLDGRSQNQLFGNAASDGGYSCNYSAMALEGSNQHQFWTEVHWVLNDKTGSCLCKL
jgi:hypothetical protein